MNLALWIAAGVLAAVFAGASIMKLAVSKEKMAAAGLDWVADVNPNAIRLLGLAELLGAIGLILPAVTHIAPVLVPLAAVGLALVLVGAIVIHARRKEIPNIALNLVLLALAVFVAWARFGAYAF
jgi:DoxX-like family